MSSLKYLLLFLLITKPNVFQVLDTLLCPYRSHKAQPIEAFPYRKMVRPIVIFQFFGHSTYKQHIFSLRKVFDKNRLSRILKGCSKNSLLGPGKNLVWKIEGKASKY
jgi:hypothetical protein